LTIFVVWVQWLRRKRGAGKNHPAPRFRSAHCTHTTAYAGIVACTAVIKTVGVAHTQPHPMSRQNDIFFK